MPNAKGPAQQSGPVPAPATERGVARTPGDERFYQGVEDLSSCLRVVRKEALKHYEDESAECHEEP